jgi:hypothetical protein
MQCRCRFAAGAVRAEEKRLAAAQRKRGVPGAWKGRLGALTARLLTDGHPAAAEVAALLGYADAVDSIPGFFEPALLEVGGMIQTAVAQSHC